ncbi:hypothetical protein DCS_01148 [Drechmeria coniospora]|uniref:Cell wall galactomannoprotein n=1 Tax=Drechmeria coniospora TaxID=98403 RepID=A0A151GSC1_DRECN|nr:hypothetical protein DCS_01148 [Drechmeria coniospora]KYK60014.1 hypothetical protein DCS_01148 [Drechmeria coniospora]ODA78814.1 hypothetical protein RJ55_06198 [Drechmeria coniospora]
MRFITLAYLAPCAIAAGAGIVERDASVIKSAIEEIGAKMNAYDTAIDNYTGGNTSAIIATVEDLDVTLEEAVKKVVASNVLTQEEALSLKGIFTPVYTKGKEIEGELLTDRAKIAAMGRCKQVLQRVTDLHTNMVALGKAIISKLPAEDQAAAQAAAASQTPLFEKSMDDFSAANCVDQIASTSTYASNGTASATQTTAASTHHASTVVAAGSALVAPVGALAVAIFAMLL